MGKATGLQSQFRGKVGNVIGYLSKNRAGRYEQIVKSYQPVVANPQSYAQALARVPVGPVQRVCSALLPLIQRGFEGTAYGEPSKSEFLSYNLKYFRGPFMPKGTVAVPPGNMLISKGSLETIEVTEFLETVDYSIACFNLTYTRDAFPNSKGQIAANLLNNNNWLVAGEQLTFIIVRLDRGVYNYHYESLFLNPNDTSAPRGILKYVSNNDDGFNIAIGDDNFTGDVAAAACIRSQAYGESSFKRSTAFLTLNNAIYQYNDDVAVRAAVASYRTGEDPEDWEDDPTPEYQQLAYLCMVTITQDMVLTSDWPYAQGKQCLGYVTKGGEMGIFYAYQNTVRANCLLDENAEFIIGSYQSTSGPIRVDARYQPSRVYSTIYGTMNAGQYSNS